MKSLTKNTNKLLAISMAVAGLFALSSTAQAMPIVGGIGFSGGASYYTSTSTIGGGTQTNGDLSLANNVQFGLASNGYGVSNQTQKGTYAAIPDITPVTFQPFLFTTAPIADLWKFTLGANTYSFDLGATPLAKTWNAVTSTLGLSGLGILKATGYDNTPGYFNFSSQNGSTDLITFSASAQSAVPIPAALFFAVPALLGVFGVSRRKTGTGSAA